MRALEGLRVLDFGHYLAGPLTGMLLADQGADVIRITPPGGSRWQTPANAMFERGKRSLTLDLKQSSDLERAVALAESADVLIENFRPGVMERLGLGSSILHQKNDRLVYCSIPGFASDDPRASVRAWEGVLGAATATYTVRPEAGIDQPYLFTAIPISSVFGSLLASTSIMAALIARERTGVGQCVEIPLFDATFTAIGSRGAWMERPLTPPARITPYVNQYLGADGRWLQLHAINRRFVDQFLKAAGIEHWASEGFADLSQLVEDEELREVLRTRMEALFRTRDSEDWEERITAAGTPAAVIRSASEWLSCEQARVSGSIVAVDDPELRHTLQPGPQVRWDGGGSSVRPRSLEDDSDAEGWLHPRMSSGGRKASDSRVALEGVRVLDLTLMLAGPTCGRTLGEFGADVIKIDNPNREGGVRFHYFTNSGKRSLLLDLKSRKGLDIFWRLLQSADIVVENFRKGVTDRLGISYADAREHNSNIIYVSLNAYGQTGPWATRPGWEQLAQASTGMQERLGGDGRPLLQPNAVTDYGSGMSAAFAATMGLYHRQRTGEGCHVMTSLAQAAGLLQAPYLVSYAGKHFDEPRGPVAHGFGPLQRIFESADGDHFFMAATESDMVALASLAQSARTDVSPDNLAVLLEDLFRREPCEHWLDTLADLGIGAHRLATVEDLMTDSWVQEHGLSLTRTHGAAGLVRTTGPAPRLSQTPVRVGHPAPTPGSDALSILSEVGLDPLMDELVETGVVRLFGTPAL